MKNGSPSPLDMAESLVAAGRSRGADEIQATVAEGSEFSTTVREGRIESLLEAGSRSVSVKVIVDKKVATASSSDLSKDTLERMVAETVDRAARMSADPCAGLPETAERAVDPESLDLFDPAIPDLPAETKISMARKTEALCLADSRIKKSYGASVGTFQGTVALANSRGFAGMYRRTSCSCGVSLQAGEGDNLIDEGWSDASHRLDRLLDPESIARLAVDRTVRLIGARKVETQNCPVVMEPSVASSYLGFLAQCVGGGSVYLRQSFLADRMGQPVGNGLVSVTDDGLIRGGPGTRPFDAEGVPARRTPILERGVLRNFLLDTYSGRKLGLSSTGNASGVNNFWMEAGSSSADEIIRSTKNGLYLTGTIGFGLVAVTGDISQGAFGIWIKDGELAFPVAEITLSGNLGTLLQNVEMVGDDPERKWSVSAPTVKIAEMSVGGK
jgi:PmbA protein